MRLLCFLVLQPGRKKRTQIFGISHIRGTTAKQQRLIATGGDIDLIHLIFLRGEQFRHKGGDLGIYQFHMENVVFIGDFLKRAAICWLSVPGCPLVPVSWTMGRARVCQYRPR